MHLQTIPQIQSIEYKRESELPFYRINSDPFSLSRHWEELKTDPKFWAVMQTLWQCNKNALESGCFHWTKIDGEKQLFADDISLQAFFLSFSEVLREQWKVVDILWFISNLDLVNFAELFTGYGNGKKRVFHKNMVFNFSWFQELMRHYESNGFQPYDKFQEFRRMGERSHKWINSEINKQMQMYGEVNIQFYQSGWHGTMDFFFNFSTWETRIEMKDFVMDGTHKFMWFSEYLDSHNPFQEKNKLNFLYPMWYRGFVFPMIWVTKIVLKTREGKSHEYSHTAWHIDRLKSVVPKNVQGLIGDNK